MNLRTDIAEKPFSCAVIHENDTDKILFGSMQVKTFYNSFGEDIDYLLNEFLSQDPIYILNITSAPSIDGKLITTRILYRTILRRPQNANT